MTQEPESISEAEARDRRDAAIVAHLGPDWQTEGWTLVDGHNYMARLNKGRTNLDFYVDLLGEVEVVESEINPAQESGKLLALTFLIGSVLTAIILARIAGYL